MEAHSGKLDAVPENTVPESEVSEVTGSDATPNPRPQPSSRPPSHPGVSTRTPGMHD